MIAESQNTAAAIIAAAAGVAVGVVASEAAIGMAMQGRRRSAVGPAAHDELAARVTPHLRAIIALVATVARLVSAQGTAIQVVATGRLRRGECQHMD